MDILAELQTVKDNYTKLEADYKAASELLDNSSKEVVDFKAVLTDKETVIAGNNAKINELLTQLAEAQQALASLEASQKTAKEQAVEMVAEQGIAPMQVDSQESNKATKEEALKQYLTLQAQDPFKAGQFYAANKDLIFS